MTQDQGADAPDTTAPGEAAEVAEALDATTIDVEWNDQTWSVPANYGLVSAIAFRAIARLGDASDVHAIAGAVDVVEELLGPSQFRRWSRGDRAAMSDAFDFVNAVMAAWGTTPGE